jgi:hypothetical protein
MFWNLDNAVRWVDVDAASRTRTLQTLPYQRSISVESDRHRSTLKAVNSRVIRKSIISLRIP